MSTTISKNNSSQNSHTEVIDRSKVTSSPSAVGAVSTTEPPTMEKEASQVINQDNYRSGDEESQNPVQQASSQKMQDDAVDRKSRSNFISKE